MSEINKFGPKSTQMNALNQGPLSNKKNQVTEEQFREVSDMYEQHFIRQMMKEMRSTVKESGFLKQNNAEKIFRDQLDDKYAEEWGKSGGVGLSDLIHEQLMQKYGTQLGLREKVEKPQGPIEFNAKSNISIPSGPGGQGVQIKFEPDENSTSSVAPVKNPWAGTLLEKKYLEMDQMQYRIKHDNGLESLIMTRGTGSTEASKLSLGDAIGAGQQLGLRDETSPLFWTIKLTVSE